MEQAGAGGRCRNTPESCLTREESNLNPVGEQAGIG